MLVQYRILSGALHTCTCTCTYVPLKFVIFAKIIIDCLFEAILGQSYLSLKCSKRSYSIGG